jgi:DNA-binding MarR family transcriptional regulator
MYAVLDAPLPVPFIARNMGLTRQSVQRTVDLLAAEELVALTDNPHHRRARLVNLTERGQTLLTEVLQRQGAWADELARGMATEELQRGTQLLESIRRRLEVPHSEGLTS